MEWEKAPFETLKHRLQTAWKMDNADEAVIRFDIQRTEELVDGFSDSEYGCHPGLDYVIKGQPIDVIIGGPHAKRTHLQVA